MVQGRSYLRHICFFFLDVLGVLLRTCIELRLKVSKHTFSPVMPSGCFCHGNAPNVCWPLSFSWTIYGCPFKGRGVRDRLVLPLTARGHTTIHVTDGIQGHVGCAGAFIAAIVNY